MDLWVIAPLPFGDDDFNICDDGDTGKTIKWKPGQVKESDTSAALLASPNHLEHSSGEKSKFWHGEEVLGRSLENEPEKSGLCMVTLWPW